MKKIKEAEEASNREIAEKRKALEAELLKLENETDKAIADAKVAADAYVAAETERARRAAQDRADAILTATRREADALSAKSLSEKRLREIVDEVLFSDFKGE